MRRLFLVLALLPSLAFGQAAPLPSSVSASGVSTQPLTAPGFFPSAQDFIFYVDPTGSDSNNCTSAVTPCLTLQAAVAKLPPQWKQKARIILATGTYTISGVYNLRVGTPIESGESLVIQGSMEDSGLGERTITGVTTYGSGYVVSVTDNTLAPTLDQYEGYFLRMTTCAAGATCVGMTRIIRGNSTGGQFDFNMGGTSTTIKPAIGDKFVIERPSSVIAYDDALRIGVSSFAGNSLVLSGLRFEATGASNYIVLAGIRVYIQLSQVISSGAKGGIYLGNGGSIIAQYATGVTGAEFIGDSKLSGAGLYIYAPSYSGSTGISSTSSGTIIGSYVLRNAILSGNTSNITLSYFSGKGSRLKARFMSVFSHNAPTYGPIAKLTGSTGVGVEIGEKTQVSLQGMEISSCATNGISIITRSETYLKDISGTSNTGAGINVQGDSFVYEDTGVSVAGTTSEVLVGDQTTTHAAIAGGTSLVIPGVGSVVKYATSASSPPITVGGAKIGSSGTNISSSVRCTATLATDAIGAGTTVTQDIACVGAAVGAECSVGGPAALEAGLTQSCRISSADHVDLRTANVTAGSITPAGSQTVTVRVWNP
jgi:hypothetical protein